MKINITLIALFSLLVSVSACGGSSQKSGNTSNEPELSATAEANLDAKVEHPGKEVYNAVCLACHMADGSGVPGMHPPLIESDWVNGDKERLIKVILNGMSDEIKVKGETYSGMMPPQSQLSNQQIANVLSYVRSNFGNDSSPVTEEEVAQVRNSSE